MRIPSAGSPVSDGATSPPVMQVATCPLGSRHMADEIYKALADPTRRVILDELADHDGQSLFEICSRLSAKHQSSSSRQAISQHLAVLEDAGLVSTPRQGRFKLHYFDPTPLNEITDRWPQRRDNQ